MIKVGELQRNKRAFSYKVHNIPDFSRNVGPGSYLHSDQKIGRHHCDYRIY